MTAFDGLIISQVVEACGLAHGEHHDLLDSTQQRAQAIAQSERGWELPWLVTADQQTAGRGRGANPWWTGAGSLALSLLFDPQAWGLERRAAPQRSLVAAVALIDTLSQHVGDAEVGLHWPNDVFIAGRKVAGILIDVLPDGRHILGIGLNVNNFFAAAPAEVQSRAISLVELIGRPLDRTALLTALLLQIELAFRQLAVMPELIGRRFEELCLQTGRLITIDSGGRVTTGRCLGIAYDGALLLETDRGPERFYSGVLRHER